MLATLASTNGGRLRLTDLGRGMSWSVSRTAHQVERMRRRGLLSKETLPDNSRAAVVLLTRSGTEAVGRAAPLHVASVRRHLIDLLDEQQLDALVEIADAVRSRHEQP